MAGSIERTLPIAAGDRGRRLGTAGPDSELSRTAAAFDAMLDELEAAEARMRTFLTDASHELRSPMAGPQANAELLLREDPDRADRERVAVALVWESRRAAGTLTGPGFRLCLPVTASSSLSGGPGLG